MNTKSSPGKFITDLNIKTKIGSVLFDIILDSGFFKANDSFYVENHNHLSYEFHFIVEGSGSIEINGRSYCISPNSYYIVGPGIYHDQQVDPASPVRKYCFRMEYKLLAKKEDFFPAEENKRIMEILEKLGFFLAEDVRNSLSLIYEIQKELQDQVIGYYSRLQSMFSQLIINVIRDIASKQETRYGIPERLSYERRNQTIEKFFDANYDGNVTAADLAKLLHISIRQLNRILRETFCISFKQKLLEKRLENSKSLLKNTNLPVKVISEKVGYTTESNFFTIFKQKNGCTPNEYRHKHKTG